MQLIFLLLFCALQMLTQQYLSKDDFVRFFFEAPIENIEAENNQVSGVIGLQKGGHVSPLCLSNSRAMNDRTFF